MGQEKHLENAKEKHENTVYYCTDKVGQAQYISMLENENIEIAYLDKGLDNQFISMVEQDKKVKFYRVDSSLADALKGDGETSENEKLTELFKKVTGEKTKLRFESLKGNIPAILTVSEESRRFGEMMKLYGMGDNIPAPEDELILNTSSDTLSLLEKKYETDPEGAEKTAKQIYMLSALSQRGLSADELKEFLTLSYESINEGIK